MKNLRKTKEITVQSINIKFDKSIQLREREIAIQAIIDVETRSPNAKKVTITNKYKHKSIAVTRDIRALKKRNSDHYFVCEHETYNRVVDTK